MTENSDKMKKKKNIIIAVVFVVLIALIAIILVKINGSKVTGKDNKSIKQNTEGTVTKDNSESTEEDTSDGKTGTEDFAIFQISLKKEQDLIQLWWSELIMMLRT